VNRYILIESQGGGCDHTIGCGYRITEIEGETDQDAVAQAIAAVGAENWRARTARGNQADGAIESAKLICVARSLDIEGWLDTAAEQLRQRKASADEAKKSAAERAEYERLQAKFGGKS
jgi:C4-type Zn-finger protein